MKHCKCGMLIFFSLSTKPTLEDLDVAVNLGAMSLRHALGDPDDVTIFLFLEFYIRVEHAKLELHHERVLHQTHLE